VDILNLIPMIYGKFILYILASTRISTLLYTFVIFRKEVITGRIMVSLSAILGVYIVLLNPEQQPNIDVFSIQMLTQELLQVLIGLLAGLILNIVFEVFSALGQIVSTQIGLSLASLIDPRYGTITNLTQFYIISATLMFLLMNGHLFIIKLIMDSFTVIPVSHVFMPQHLIGDVMNYSSIMFASSAMLSITIVIAMLLTNIALAVMTKFAPQLNIFSIGINMAVIFGLILVYMTYHLFIDQGSNVLREGLNHLQTAFMKMG
jgi:flagellar biosynthetic protein FliR